MNTRVYRKPPRRTGVAQGTIVRPIATAALAALLGCLLPAISPAALPLHATGQEPEILAAKDRGVAYVKAHMEWLPPGPGSLAALALMKAGVPPETPEIQAAIKAVLNQFSSDSKFTSNAGALHIYEVGVSLMALANADAVKFKPQIQVLADYLVANQRPGGEWDYPVPSNGDTSISQYAVLGLWEATRSGCVVPLRVWDKAAAWHTSRQLADGSFEYHPGQPDSNAGGTGTHTMTCAGVGSLHVIRLHLYPEARDVEGTAPARKARGKKFGILEEALDDGDEEKSPTRPADGRPTIRLAQIDKAISRGLAWIGERFTVEPRLGHKLYYLYGLERMAALAQLTEINGHDWYTEGAAHLIKTQSSEGSWQDDSGLTPATSFGILFLSKATAKMLRAPKRPAAMFGAGLLAGGRGLPDNLADVQVEKGQVQARKLQGPVDQLLAELENAQSTKVDSAQASLVEKVSLEDREQLIGQKDRLVRLARDPRPAVRATAYWALGRTGDLRVAPLLIRGLTDPDASCMVEARNGLQYLSKKFDDASLPDEPTEAQRQAAVERWQAWYFAVRPYNERDDLTQPVASKPKP